MLTYFLRGKTMHFSYCSTSILQKGKCSIVLLKCLWLNISFFPLDITFITLTMLQPNFSTLDVTLKMDSNYIVKTQDLVPSLTFFVLLLSCHEIYCLRVLLQKNSIYYISQPQYKLTK